MDLENIVPANVSNNHDPEIGPQETNAASTPVLKAFACRILLIVMCISIEGRTEM